jgi:mlo protein
VSIYVLSNFMCINLLIFILCMGVVAVLILLGFMSLILTVTQRPISKICISNKVAYTMLPCHKSAPTRTTKALGFAHTWTTATSHEHSLPATDVFEDVPWQRERRLAAADTSNGSSDHCASQVFI